MFFTKQFVPAFVALATGIVVSGTALAQTPAPAATPPAAEPAKPEPDWTFTSNIGLYSQYVFRGITQTDEKPAVQGGFDLGHKSGFYVGTWASNVSWISDLVPPPSSLSASMEWDFYGGYKGSLPADFGYDLGVLYYWYPGEYSNAPRVTRSPTRPSSTARSPGSSCPSSTAGARTTRPSASRFARLAATSISRRATTSSTR